MSSSKSVRTVHTVTCTNGATWHDLNGTQFSSVLAYVAQSGQTLERVTRQEIETITHDPVDITAELKG